MLHPKLCRMLNFVHYHAVFFGLMGTTLRIRSHRRIIRLEKVSWAYLIYSLFVGTCLLLNIYFMFPQAILDGYTKSNIVLQWNFFVQIGLQLMAILGCYGTIWLKRRDIIEFYKESLNYWKNYGKIMNAIVDKEELKELQLSLARTMWQIVFVLYSYFFFSSVVQYQLLDVVTQYSLMALAGRFSHSLQFVAVKMGFYGVLILLDHQFGVIKLALRVLHRESSKRKWKTLRAIARMHLETLQLARRIFKLYDIANAIVFLNMFMSTMSILYHAVQYGNRTIKSDSWGMICGNGLVVSNLFCTLMLMNMLDRVVSACNNVGEQLKEFNDLPRINGKFQRELDDFAMQLRRNHLVYKICGIVELDKPAGLSYIGSILSNIIILMQFDLRRQQQPSKSQYFEHFSKNNSKF
ncbi:putative gustatory receptor 58b [Drosophila kikkawai]|uniref:Gustatory receptor n=1 Tax=Drosophila kikkawai TaxID=30033 RepID=A0A6P4I4G7_DROKI|nr:putative gustatory receptor 58b [Drosophila kikkawai]